MKANVKLEIFIIDDGSSDASADFARKKYPGIKLLINEKNRGRAFSRNRGMAAAGNNVMLFIDSDVWPGNGCLEQLYENISDNDIVYPKLAYEDGAVKHPKDDNSSYPYDAGCFMIKMPDGKDVKFDENFKYLEDQDFFIRCHLNNFKAKYVRSAVAFHSNRQTTSSGSEKFYQEMCDIVYGMNKYRGKKIKPVHNFSRVNLVKGLVAAIFNYNYFFYGPSASVLKKISRLFLKHKKFEISNFKMLRLYFKALKNL